MSRTVEGIVESHRIARERQAAGLPVWEYKVDVSPWWRDESLTFEERRDAIVAAIKASRWYVEMGGEFLEEVVDNLAAAEDAELFDVWWDELYDIADGDRAWINTFGSVR